MKIVIDARLVSARGIGTYLTNLITELQKLDTENKYIVLLKDEDLGVVKVSNPNFTKVPCSIREYSLKEQILLPKLLKSLNPDVVHFPNVNIPLFYSGQFVVTIHDLIMLENFEKKEAFIRKLKRNLLSALLHFKLPRAKMVLTVSKYVKNEVIKRFKLKEEDVLVTYNGISNELVKANKGHKLNYGNYILYVGSLYPHKNVDFLLKVLPSIPQSLVVVGKNDKYLTKFKQQVVSLGLEHKVNFTGYVTKEQLQQLYIKAYAFVSPTLAEGFGLPGLEAMLNNCPIVVSDIPVLKEVYGNGALYFRVNDTEDLIQNLKKLENENVKIDLVKKGLEVTQAYNWVDTARLTFKAYVT